MPSFDIVKKSKPKQTFRVSNVLNTFDLDIEKVREHFKGSIDIEGKEWNIGIIVGGSGTGKSTIANEVFGDHFMNYDYKSEAVIDDMPKSKSVKEVTKAFTSVGFASPPSWLKPYDVLSNGEKMRCDLANCILQDSELIIFDEYTSVVNREVAKTGSVAIAKAVRKMSKQFIAVGCHSDIVEWLEPDWIYNTDEQRFFFALENTKDQASNLRYSGLGMKTKNEFGKYSGSITI